LPLTHVASKERAMKGVARIIARRRRCSLGRLHASGLCLELLSSRRGRHRLRRTALAIRLRRLIALRSLLTNSRRQIENASCTSEVPNPDRIEPVPVGYSSEQPGAGVVDHANRLLDLLDAWAGQLRRVRRGPQC
jgi:hypothetical protein